MGEGFYRNEEITYIPILASDRFIINSCILRNSTQCAMLGARLIKVQLPESYLDEGLDEK